MVDIVNIIEGIVSAFIIISPILVQKFYQYKEAISVVQNFLDLLQVTGITLKQVTAGTVTDEQKLKLANAMITFSTAIHLDKTVNAEIKGISQSDIDQAVATVKVVEPLVESKIKGA
jgi:dissimilatory sulfite reductase (desulfoviridin) alpha/beta subunit